jgi:hypothetical protein
MSAQAAFTHVGDMLLVRYRDWYLALAELPSWGEDVDVHVQEYIEGVRSVVRANLGWRYAFTYSIYFYPLFLFFSPYFTVEDSLLVRGVLC